MIIITQAACLTIAVGAQVGVGRDGRPVHVVGEGGRERGGVGRQRQVFKFGDGTLDCRDEFFVFCSAPGHLCFAFFNTWEAERRSRATRGEQREKGRGAGLGGSGG